MSTLEILLILAGVFHFCLLPLSVQIPKLLSYKTELPKLHPFTAELFKAYGAFILLCIIAFGLLTLVGYREMAAGETLALALATFMAIFWSLRLFAALFYYDPREMLNSTLRHIGYRILTLLFAYWSGVYWFTVYHGVSHWGS